MMRSDDGSRGENSREIAQRKNSRDGNYDEVCAYKIEITM